MGYTSLARWPSAPTTGLDLVKQNIVRNHAGVERAKWLVSVRSFRTVSGREHGLQLDRSMCALTMNNYTFFVLEDPAAPAVSDLSIGQAPANAASADLASAKENNISRSLQGEHPHLRTTIVTVSPPGSMEQLIAQLGARWAPTRQPSANTRSQIMATGNQLVIDGSIFSIGTDWRVRVGNVILAGGAVKGMLLEAEYLPLPKLHSSSQSGASDLLSNLLISILPDIQNELPVVVTVDDAQWDEVQWNCNESEDEGPASEKPSISEDDDLYTYEDEEDPSVRQKGDWTGVDRDRRSAYQIIGALKSEGIL